MNHKVDLSIIIVSWNVKNHLRQCLNSILTSQGNLNLEIFVVDNNSKDESAEIVKSEFQTVKLIKNNKNLGFAKANNQALKKAKGEFVLLLNPDMRLFPDTLINVVTWMQKNPKARVAGCHLVNEQDQTIYHVRRFPTVWNQLAIILKLPHILPNILNKYLRKNFDYSKSQKVDSIRGGFFMIHNTPEAVTPASRLPCQLDERYFLWFEEIDFCRQVYQNRQEVWYTPAAKCIDYVGQSFKQVKALKKQKMFRQSQLKYFKKWHPVGQYWLLKLIWPIGLIIAWLAEELNLKSKTKT